MKTLKGHNGNEYNSPETVAEQKIKYRGWIISWERPPVPPGIGCEWIAYTEESGGEDGCKTSDLVDDLKAEIDEFYADFLDGKDDCEVCGEKLYTLNCDVCHATRDDEGTENNGERDIPTLQLAWLNLSIAENTANERKLVANAETFIRGQLGL